MVRIRIGSLSTALLIGLAPLPAHAQGTAQRGESRQCSIGSAKATGIVVGPPHSPAGFDALRFDRYMQTYLTDLMALVRISAAEKPPDHQPVGDLVKRSVIFARQRCARFAVSYDWPTGQPEEFVATVVDVGDSRDATVTRIAISLPYQQKPSSAFYRGVAVKLRGVFSAVLLVPAGLEAGTAAQTESERRARSANSPPLSTATGRSSRFAIEAVSSAGSPTNDGALWLLAGASLRWRFADWSLGLEVLHSLTDDRRTTASGSGSTSVLRAAGSLRRYIALERLWRRLAVWGELAAGVFYFRTSAQLANNTGSSRNASKPVGFASARLGASLRLARWLTLLFGPALDVLFTDTAFLVEGAEVFATGRFALGADLRVQVVF